MTVRAKHMASLPSCLIICSIFSKFSEADCFLMKPHTILLGCLSPQTSSNHVNKVPLETISVSSNQKKPLLQRYSQKDTPDFEKRRSSRPKNTMESKMKPQSINFSINTNEIPFVEREELIQSALEIAYKDNDNTEIIKSDVDIIGGTSQDISLSENVILLLGSGAIATLLSKGLSSFELLQDWRYTWCLIGCLYIWDGLQNIPSLVPSKNKFFNILEVLCGIGLLIGGAYDVFMPVYMTGPNVFTSAGIHQDSATVLLGLSFFAFSTSSPSIESSKAPPNLPFTILTKMGIYDRKLLQMFLLAQLYILGESSIDELMAYFT